MRFLILIAILIILGVLIEKILKKLLGINKKGKISETPGKQTDRWGRGIILVLFLCTLPFVINKDIIYVQWYYMLYLILLLGLQTILEWKYLRETNQYVITLVFLLFSIVIFYNIDFFLVILG